MAISISQLPLLTAFRGGGGGGIKASSSNIQVFVSTAGTSPPTKATGYENAADGNDESIFYWGDVFTFCVFSTASCQEW